MKYFILLEINIAIDNIQHEFEGFNSSKSTFFLEDGAQITILTQFGNDVAIIDGDEDVFGGQDIGMRDMGKDVDL